MSVSTTTVPQAPEDGEHLFSNDATFPENPVSTGPGGSISLARATDSLTGEKGSVWFARRTLGIVFLLVTVILWTVSNFLGSTILADDSFSKPYFVTYVNTSFFSIFLPVILVKRLWQNGWSIARVWRGETGVAGEAKNDGEECESLVGLYGRSSMEDLTRLLNARASSEGLIAVVPSPSGLTARETAVLSLEFCLLWFAANYFIAACLEYTTVASSTILMSTSSIWTLLFGALIGVESFTVKKLIGVLASLSGILLISSVDFSGETDKNRGSFPHKSPTQIAIGDALALGSAVIYGVYSVFMVKRIGNESRVDMLLFFGFVGTLNTIFLWPFFFILHYTGLEVFELPPDGRIWTIIIANSISSLVADVAWAYALLLTSPLVVTVGLSMSIPLSLIGQMIVNSQKSGVVYWIGAAVVFISFIFINHESKVEETPKSDGVLGDDISSNGEDL